MPQLNPSPWFAILLFSWLILLTIIPSKLVNHTFPNEISALAAEKPQINHWTWPW